MRKQLLIAIMPIGRQNVHVDFCFENSIDKSMLLGDFATPSAFRFTFQWFRMPQTGFGMIIKLADKSQCFLVSQVAPLFSGCVGLDNVSLPADFWDVLGLKKMDAGR